MTFVIPQLFFSCHDKDDICGLNAMQSRELLPWHGGQVVWCWSYKPNVRGSNPLHPYSVRRDIAYHLCK